MTAPGVIAYASRISTALEDVYGSDLVGVYLHGSAALGGFVPSVSDVDILAVVARPRRRRSQRKIGRILQAVAEPCPGSGLEASVITAAAAHSLDGCSFEVHVSTQPDHRKLVCGARHVATPTPSSTSPCVASTASPL